MGAGAHYLAPVRIALFAETYAPQRNGVAVLLDRLVRHLTGLGHEVLVVAPESGRPRGDAPTRDGVAVVRVKGIPLPRYPDLTIGIPFAPSAMDAAAAFRPHVVHAVTEYAMGLTGVQVARSLGVPVLASFHTNIPDYLPYYGFRWASEPCWRYLRWFHDQAVLTFAPSEATRSILEARGFRNVRLWPRGVDPAQFSPAHRNATVRARWGDPGGLHLVYVGRLTPEKDLAVLFDAFERVRRRSDLGTLHLTLVGDGAYSGVMRQRAPAGVTFTGYLEGEDLSRAYASADVFAFPSRSETLGNAVLEAMSSGLPVVAVREGGTLENVRDGVNGVLCQPGDPAAFADGIARLAADPDLRGRLSRTARSWAEQRNWAAAFAPLVSAYEELHRG